MTIKNNKKYSIQVEKVKSSWTANIVRKLSATRASISKSKSKFKTKKEATIWAEEVLAEFTKIQASSNDKKTQQRTRILKSKQDRSERRAAKTVKAKAQKEKDQKAKEEIKALEIDDFESNTKNNIKNSEEKLLNKLI